MGRNNKIESLVYTVKERCKICYTCIRECPAKAIKIANGQAQVIDERCIGCGNCVKVCNQHAKQYYKSVDHTLELINSNEKVAVCLSPSFPAEFTDIVDYKIIVGMLRKTGFDYVHEVAFGADLIAIKYKETIASVSETRFISSDCPAIVTYVEKYYPHLVNQLVPFVSPMIATARVLRKKYGSEIKVVFVGPCIAKKGESDELDTVITFTELRDIFNILKITKDFVSPSDFDPPLGGKGAIFALSRGLLQNVELKDSILEGNIIVAAGRSNFQEAIKEFDVGLIKSQNLELLCCEGCIMGVGMSQPGQHYSKRAFIRNYVDNKLKTQNMEQWQLDILQYENIDLSQTFKEDDRRIFIESNEDIDKLLADMGKTKASDHLNCGACGYDTCVEHALAIYKGLAENEMCLPYTIEKLHKSIDELAVTNEKLAGMQLALKQSEKLAHMGQLSAGIAHELNNPLGVIIMYSNILLEDCPPDSQLRNDLDRIVKQAARCKTIVSGLLNFARNNQVKYEQVDLHELIDFTIHSIIIPINIKIIKDIEKNLQFAMLDKEQMVQAISNLLKNAVEAMPDGGTLTIKLERDNGKIIFSISDSGTGILNEHMDKLFTPFFTTKAPGKGTGLGLPTTYGIVKMHKGDITLTTNADVNAGPTGTTFKIAIPIK